jgi:hypothetical protein
MSEKSCKTVHCARDSHHGARNMRKPLIPTHIPARRRGGARCSPQRLVVAFLVCVIIAWVTALVVWSSRRWGEELATGDGVDGDGDTTPRPRRDDVVVEGMQQPTLDEHDDDTHVLSSGSGAQLATEEAAGGGMGMGLRPQVQVEQPVASIATVVTSKPSSDSATTSASVSRRPGSKWARVAEDVTRRDRVKAAMKGMYGVGGCTTRP